MQARALSGAENSALPPRRPRWLCHLSAAGFVLLDVAMVIGVDNLAYRLVVHDPGWFVEDTVELVARGLPGVLLLPAFRRVSFRKRDVLFFALLPFWGFVIAWKVGFRLMSLPYRDWPARPDEYARTQDLSGSPSDVVVPADEPASTGEVRGPAER